MLTHNYKLKKLKLKVKVNII